MLLLLLKLEVLNLLLLLLLHLLLHVRWGHPHATQGKPSWGTGNHRGLPREPREPHRRLARAREEGLTTASSRSCRHGHHLLMLLLGMHRHLGGHLPQHSWVRLLLALALARTLTLCRSLPPAAGTVAGDVAHFAALEAQNVGRVPAAACASAASSSHSTTARLMTAIHATATSAEVLGVALAAAPEARHRQGRGVQLVADAAVAVFEFRTAEEGRG